MMLLCIMACLVQALILGILVWAGYEYIRLRRQLAIVHTVALHVRSEAKLFARAMNCDELVDQLLEEQLDTPVTVPPRDAGSGQAHKANRERLAALAAGGQARQYLGKALTADQVDSMDDEEVERLYARYEARLGAAMTKTLRQAVLQAYSWAAGMVLPIPPQNQPKLVADLEADPFIGHALSSATCELYHRYGMYLAPLTAALTTAKYCQIERTQHDTMPSMDDEAEGQDTKHVGIDSLSVSGLHGNAGESDHQ
jgi:hypothetical protein